MSQNPQYPYMPMMPQQQQPQQQQPAQMPQFYMPQDPVEAQRQFQQSVGGKSERGKINGLDVRYADVPGPRGEKDWKDVQPGYQGSQRTYLLPSWRPEGLPIFVLSEWHYWRSMRYPKGMSCGCTGRDTCEICQAAMAAEGNPDPRVVQRAKEYGRNRRKWLYQCVLLDYPQLHVYEDGKLRPAILACSYTLQQALRTICTLKHRSITDCVHPQLGNPWVIAKKKTGQNAMDVEYSAVDLAPEPLPQQFWPVLSNLWDLTQLVRVSTEQERHAAAIDMGLISGAVSVQVPQQYQQQVPQQYPQPNTIQPAAPPLPYQTAPGMGLPGYQQAAQQPQAFAYQPPPTDEQQLQFPPSEQYGAFAQPPQQPFSYQQQGQVPVPSAPAPLPAAPSTPPPMAYQPQPASHTGQAPLPGVVPMPPPPPIPLQAPQVANQQELLALQARLAGK